MQRPKISIIGAGMVGGTCAMEIAGKELGDIVLFDIKKGLPQGKALDIRQSGAIKDFNLEIVGTNCYCDTKDSDIVIITAGSPRKTGMSREDLLKGNKDTIKNIVENVASRSPNSIIIMVSNPLDVMTYLAYKVSGFSGNRVIGQAGVLDSARFKTLVAQEIGVYPKNVEVMVLGSHGDTMVILPKLCSVSGIPLKYCLGPNEIERIIEKTKNGGAEIVSLLGTGSAFAAPAAAVTKMVESIIRDKKEMMPCSIYLNGEWGIKDICFGVPVTLGDGGVEAIWNFFDELSGEEMSLINKAAKIIRENIKKLGKL